MTAATQSPLLDRATHAVIASERTKYPMQRFVAERFAQAALDACRAEELAAAVRANDALIREIRHRDSRWHDDELVMRLLDRNRTLLAELESRS